MKVVGYAAIVAVLSVAIPALAQTAQDQGARSEAQTAAQTESAPPPFGMPGGGPGMMGAIGPGGMVGPMGPGMMGGGMMGMMGMGVLLGIEHVEGQLAFLRTELKITDAQTPQWNAFADVVRGNAKAMAEAHQQIVSQQDTPKTLPERLALEAKALAAHLDAFKRTEAALDKLYDALGAEQKKEADEIIVGPMGMPMGMM